MVRVPTHPKISMYLGRSGSVRIYKPGMRSELERSRATRMSRRPLMNNFDISRPTPKERKRKISSRGLNKLFAEMIRPLSGRYLFKDTIRRITRKKNKWQADKRRILSPYVGTPRVPVYVKLPLGTMDMECCLVYPCDVFDNIEKLDSISVDGLTVVVWWGIVEADNPRQYDWSGYKMLFSYICREIPKMKIQVVMAFHECGGNDGDVYIPLPKWIKKIGKKNPDIYFTDRNGRRNPETLTWGIDEERVLRGRTALEVYVDFMKSFQAEFDEFLKSGTIAKIEIGLGACGELRYPSYSAKHGWEYPRGIGEFQCYDKYLKKSLEEAAERRAWGSPPDNAGSYNYQPQHTGFFCDGGGYCTAYGRFFLNWYSQCLIDHADRVLAMAKGVFSEATPIAVKLSGIIHRWYKSDSHAPELTAGYYNTATRDGYAPIVSMLKKNKTGLNFTCAQLEGFPPGGIVSQVLNAAWDAGIQVASESAFPCYDRKGYNKILKLAKPINNPDGRHLSAFTHLLLDDDRLFEEDNFREFKLFVRRMHGVKR